MQLARTPIGCVRQAHAKNPSCTRTWHACSKLRSHMHVRLMHVHTHACPYYTLFALSCMLCMLLRIGRNLACVVLFLTHVHAHKCIPNGYPYPYYVLGFLLRQNSMIESFLSQKASVTSSFRVFSYFSFYSDVQGYLGPP